MKTVPLRRIASMKYGNALASDERRPGPVPVMSSGGVTGQHDAANTSAPAIIVGRKGSHGSLWWTDEPAFVIDTAYSIDELTTEADLRWLFYALSTVGLSHLSNDVGVPGLSRSAAYDARLPLAPLAEQRRIADFLDDRVSRIDRIIAARREQRTLVEEAFRRTRWDVVTNANWPSRRLSQLARMGTGHTPSKSNSDYWLKCDIPWLTTSDVHRFRQDEIDRISETAFKISPLGLANSAAVMHSKGTVALSRTASAGFSIIMDVQMATSQDFVTWTCGRELDPEFLLQVLRARRPYLLDYLSMGSTHKTIYFPDLMDLTIQTPTLDLQRRAVKSAREAADSRLRARTAMSEQIDLLTEYKSSLITAAVTGELDVTTAGSNIPG